jgi:putative transcription factor
MQCEMCGTEKELMTALVEGVEMSVCISCSKYGKAVQKKTAPKTIVHEKQRYAAPVPEYVDEIVQGCSDIIRRAATKKNIQEDALAKRIGMKESVLKAYMKGSMAPSIEDARKLEKFFSIKLVERVKENSAAGKMEGQRSADLTIGDMIRIKKR